MLFGTCEHLRPSSSLPSAPHSSRSYFSSTYSYPPLSTWRCFSIAHFVAAYNYLTNLSDMPSGSWAPTISRLTLCANPLFFLPFQHPAPPYHLPLYSSNSQKASSYSLHQLQTVGEWANPQLPGALSSYAGRGGAHNPSHLQTDLNDQTLSQTWIRNFVAIQHHTHVAPSTSAIKYSRIVI